MTDSTQNMSLKQFKVIKLKQNFSAIKELPQSVNSPIFHCSKTTQTHLLMQTH